MRDRVEVIETIGRLRRRIEDKVLTDQGDVPTFFDNYILQSVNAIEQQMQRNAAGEEHSGAAELVARLASVFEGPRFVPWAIRAAETKQWQRLPWELTWVQLSAGQGIANPLAWRGRALFKSVFDFAIYPMLIQELRPATIVELGSGTGASAMWLADLARSLEIATEIISIDLKPPLIEYSDVKFVAGDVNAIEDIGRNRGIPFGAHPWLVIEDAHVNMGGVLEYFSTRMKAGDYLVVEDSFHKQADLARFNEASPGVFDVDTRYTDFFGRNAVSAVDSVLIRARKDDPDTK